MRIRKNHLLLTIAPVIFLACQPDKNSETVTYMKDPHSFSNPDQVSVRHLDWEALIDFDTRTISATATLELDFHTQADTLILDSRGLKIKSIVSGGENVPVTVGPSTPIFGQALSIPVSIDRPTVTIRYETSPDAAALQWLTAAQTTGKSHPFLFTQSQAILARTWIPLQDAPQVRFTYSARVKASNGLRVLMSASNPDQPDSSGYWSFRMTQPIPSYLMALAAGNLEFRPIDHRSGVYAEPEVVEGAAREFSDTGKMISAAEALYGPYLWDRYDILVLPPSFPFGGMENPRLTFATPTILAGDKSLVALVAHELAHSWSGNLVTNSVWDDFWLNEGFTVYFEGRIMEAVYGRDFAVMEQTLSFNGLKETVKEMGADHPDSRLKLDLAGRDPDEGVSDIAYEKGANFLRVCEREAGREKWDAFLKSYFTTHAFTSVTTEQFLEFFNRNFIAGDTSLARRIDAETWIYKPGIPDNAVSYQSAKLQAVDQQVADWAAGKPAGKLNTAAWTTPEWLYFLRQLPHDQRNNRMEELDQAFGFSRSGNSEILAEWLGHSIDVGYEPAMPVLESFLMKVGRRKFLRPLYEKLASTPEGLAWATRVYSKARPGYHFVSANTIDSILKFTP